LTESCGGWGGGDIGLFFNGLGGEIEGCNGATAVNPIQLRCRAKRDEAKKGNATADGFNVRTIPILL